MLHKIPPQEGCKPTSTQHTSVSLVVAFLSSAAASDAAPAVAPAADNILVLSIETTKAADFLRFQ